MPHLRLAAAQLNTVVGDLSGNVERVLRAVAAAEAVGADICVAPELAIPGYPPEDLLLKPGFVADNVTALEKVAAATGQCAVVVGFVGAAPGARAWPTQRPCAPAGVWSGSTANISCPTTACSTSSAGSCPARSHRPSSAWPAPGSASPSARTSGSTTVPWRRPAGPAPTSSSTSTRRPTTGAGTPNVSPCCADGWRRPGAPSPTSTRWAGRTSWSSTATRSSSPLTARWSRRARSSPRTS